jgi:1-acyl-sn-glycerol-3-phosphate acyltransferase
MSSPESTGTTPAGPVADADPVSSGYVASTRHDPAICVEGPLPEEPPQRPVRLHGSRLARALLRLAGWEVDFDGLPAAQGVLIVYPHTSNWDFVIGILAKWSIGIPVAFWAKHTLFSVPLFGRWLRWVGGVPLDRSSPVGVVSAMVRRLQAARGRGGFFWLALSPEGTRRWVPGWRSGFHRVAMQADVPLALAHLDWGRRRVGVGPGLRLGGDETLDMAEIARRYDGVRGFHPELAAPVRLVSGR